MLFQGSRGGTAISAIQSDAETSDGTDWNQIAALCASLFRHTDSPVVHLNHGVAMASAHGYVYCRSARGSLLDDCGDTDAALRCTRLDSS